jgi:hypothetical protein
MVSNLPNTGCNQTPAEIVELLHEGIRKNAYYGQSRRKDAFYPTKPCEVEGTNGKLIIFLLATREGNDEGVPEGVYAVTTVSPQDYEKYRDLKRFVRTHVTRKLREICGFERQFELRVAQTTPGGSAVLRIEPQESPVITPSKVILAEDRPIHDSEFFGQLLLQGKPVLMGVLPLSGREGHIVSVVGIIQATSFTEDRKKAEHFQGWLFFKGHPKLIGRKGLHRIDASRSKKVKLTLQKSKGTTYIVAEVDPSLVEVDANKRELQEVIDWALTFIHD